MNISIDLRIADGVYTCKIGIHQALEIETACGGDPIGRVVARLMAGAYPDLEGMWHHNPLEAAFGIRDVHHTIKQALIGGAHALVDGISVPVPPHRVTEIMERYIEPLPLIERWKIARAIVFALVEGYEPPEKKKEVTKEASPPPRRRRSTATSHA